VTARKQNDISGVAGVISTIIRPTARSSARPSSCSAAPRNHPSMKIASSKPSSSWNCRSMSTPSSWKSGTSSSADAQYPESSNAIPPLLLSLTLVPLVRSISRVFMCPFTKNYARTPLKIARVRGTWQTRHLFCHAYAPARSLAFVRARTPAKKVKNIILRLAMG